MNTVTTFLLKFLRVVFLLASFAGLLILLDVSYLTLFPPATTSNVVMLNVQQRVPSYTAPVSPVTVAKEEVAAGKPTQLVMHSQNGTLVLREPQASRRLLVRIINAEKGPLPLLLAGLLFSLIIAKILGDVKPGVPFTPANIRRLYWLAMLFVGCEVYQRAASWWMQHYLRSVTPAGLVELMPNSQFNSSMVSNGIAAAMLIILAASYRRGVELTEDAELTV